MFERGGWYCLIDSVNSVVYSVLFCGAYFVFVACLL